MQRDHRGSVQSGSSTDDTGEQFVQLGLDYTTGHSVAVDLVTAHKWFNLAAMLGNKSAIRLRREIAAEMTDAEIITAQRAARAWITAH
jgi:TPR repeat protein